MTVKGHAQAIHSGAWDQDIRMGPPGSGELVARQGESRGWAVVIPQDTMQKRFSGKPVMVHGTMKIAIVGILGFCCGLTLGCIDLLLVLMDSPQSNMSVCWSVLVGAMWDGVVFAFASWVGLAVMWTMQRPDWRYRWLTMGAVFAGGLPIIMQLHLRLSVSVLGVLWPLEFVFGELLLLAGVAVCAMMLARATRTRSTTVIPAGAIVLFVYLALFVPLGVNSAEELLYHQRTRNDALGSELAGAIEKYAQHEGRYPKALGELKSRYLPALPWYSHGFLRVPFIYWTEEGKPFLKYCPGGWSGRFFDFEKMEWHSQTL